jgi:hypothetical protein
MSQSFTVAFVVVVGVLLLAGHAKNIIVPSEVRVVQSTVDGRQYLVRDLPDSQAAADFLASLRTHLMKLVRAATTRHPTDPDYLRLAQRFPDAVISEGSHESGYTSYSINKGERVVVCLRNKDNSFADRNVVMYVAIHELAHIMTSEVGHTAAFWNNFRRLLQVAVSERIYHRVDYSKHPSPYCGITISQSVI